MKIPYSNTYNLLITEADKTVKKTFEVDKSVVIVSALALTASKEDLMYCRGTIRLEINKNELYSEGTPAKKIYSLPTVDANNRAYRIGSVATGNGLITLEYTDNADGRTVFSSYIVSLTIDGERETDV